LLTLPKASKRTEPYARFFIFLDESFVGVQGELAKMKASGIALAVLTAFASIADAQKPANYEINLPGTPFGVVVSRDQQWIFVSLADDGNGPGAGITVLRNKDGRIEIVRTVPMKSSPAGMVLTHDGDMLIVAANDSIVFFDTQRLETGQSDPAFQWVSDGPNAGSIYVNVTDDDKTLFVSDEGKQTITVMDLDRIRALGRDSAANLKRVNTKDGASSAIIGTIPVGIAPIALTFSKDQRWLFTTSEISPADWKWPRVLEPEGGRPSLEKDPEGAVIVIDTAKAKIHPEDSVRARIPAGGSPVRLALAPDGCRLFVTARNSNAILVFDTAELLNDPDHAKPVKIPVGTSPVPVVIVQNGKLALVGNSNRFNPDATKKATLSVMDTSRIGTERNPVLGQIPCGAFPREFHLTTDGETLFLTNFRSHTLQVIAVSRLMEILKK
jgi:DNA-binding beta-propeller fold protein YncE